MIPWFNKEKKVVPHEAKLKDQGDAELNTSSPTWKYIEKWSKNELEKLRRDNDSPKLDEQSTAFIRGRIKELQTLRDLPTKGRNKPPRTEPPFK
jgi:hypothetical protein